MQTFPADIGQALLVAFGMAWKTGWTLVPEQSIDIRRELTSFSIDYTFWLNIVFAVPAAWLFWKGLKGGGMHHHHDHSGGHEHSGHRHHG